MGYVNNIALVVSTKNFMKTHQILKNMMLWPKGAFRWPKSHNSHFETTKLVIIDFSWSKSIERPPPLPPGYSHPSTSQPQVCRCNG